MSHQSSQSNSNPPPKDSPDPGFTPLHCPIKGHSNHELKFFLKSDFPNINRIYCSSCIIEEEKNSKLNKKDFLSIDAVLEETGLLSQQYMSQLDPLVVKLQTRQEQVTKNDFKSMFQSVITKREYFRKLTHEFKMKISMICQRYEEFFEKHLETLFYQSFFAIDSRLSSFKDTFELLRLRLSSYNQELEKKLAQSESMPQLCENLNTVLKDYNSLKSSNLVKLLVNELEDTSPNSVIAEIFNENCVFENEVTKGFNSALKALSAQLEMLRISMKDMEKKPKEEKSQAKEQKQIGGQSSNQGSVPSEGKKEPVLVNNKDQKDPAKEKAKGQVTENKEAKKEEKEPQKIWADPADESIEVFEREIAKFYQKDLIKKLSEGLEKKRKEEEAQKQTTTEEKKEAKDVKEVKEVQAETKPAVSEKKEPVEDVNKQQKEQVKVQKENGKDVVVAADKTQAQSKADAVKGKIQEFIETVDSDEDYSSEEEEYVEEDEGAIHREFIYQLKNSAQPEIFRKISKSRKYSRRGDRNFKFGLVKLAQTVYEKNDRSQRDEYVDEDEEEHCVSFVLTNKDNKGKHKIIAKKKRDTREGHIEASKGSRNPIFDFFSQIQKEMAPKSFEKLKQLIFKIKVPQNDKNKRLAVDDILGIQDFIGEFLRENHKKHVLEYRRKRRQYNDSDEAMKYNYACRDFFIKYYNHYKSVKAMFLDELGVSKTAFNDDYRYWIEHDHGYLAWSRFKSKIQKALVGESKHTLKATDLKGILHQLLIFLKEPLGEFKEDLKKTKKRERYLLIELLLARIYDRAFFAFQIEEEDILASLNACTGPIRKEVQRLYEEFEEIVANLMYPELKIKIRSEE